VSILTRSSKFVIFIFISSALHLLFFLSYFTDRSVSQSVQSIGIGLVQRPFSHFIPVAQTSELLETLPELHQPDTAKEKQNDLPVVKPQVASADTEVLKLERKSSVERPDKLLIQLLITPVERVQSEVQSALPLKYSPDSHSKNTEIIDPLDMVVDVNDQRQGLGVPKVLGPVESVTSKQGGSTSGDAVQIANRGVKNALPRYDLNPRPTYPEVSRRRGQQGTVLLEVAIQIDGSVEKVAVARSSGYKILDRAALLAVRRWQFWPAKSAGLPIASRVVVPIDFVLNEDR
jgi:TonB family protein